MDNGVINMFLICPVRGFDQEQTEETVEYLEASGYDVYWPFRDTDHDDDTGLSTCKENKKAIQEADVVGVIWDGKSQGCLFDLGIAFAENKLIEVITLPEKTKGKSFQNMVRALAKETLDNARDY
jgi:hypothetical protein